MKNYQAQTIVLVLKGVKKFSGGVGSFLLNLAFATCLSYHVFHAHKWGDVQMWFILTIPCPLGRLDCYRQAGIFAFSFPPSSG